MNPEIKSVLKKTVKVAGVTCFAAGAVAVMTSGVALKAISEGGKYLAGAVKKILQEQEVSSEAQEDITAIAEEDLAASEETPAAEEAPTVEAAPVSE